MGRVVKPDGDRDADLIIKAVQPFPGTPGIKTHELALVRGGRRAYLWFRSGTIGGVGWMHGPETLRRFAEAILAEIGPRKSRKKARVKR